MSKGIEGEKKVQEIKSQGYLEKLFSAFQKDPDSIDPIWRSYFSFFPNDISKAMTSGAFLPKVTIQKQDLCSSQRSQVVSSDQSFSNKKSTEVLFQAWIRENGHLAVQTDPLEENSDKEQKLEELFEQFLSITPDQNSALGMKQELLSWAKSTYCRSIGIEGLRLARGPWQSWLCEQIEGGKSRRPMSQERAKTLWKWLYRAQYFESFLHKKFVGQKRFSLEGHESLIPALHSMIEQASSLESQEVFLAMAHRGRLNVLAHILSKSYDEIIEEFMERRDFPKEGGGDVKYHKGFQSKWTYDERKINVQLCPNPSHLEAVNPVAQGMAYAKGKELGGMKRVLPILIHGDAAFSGQGVVYESMQLMGIEGYSCGGTIHLILNNQIGFTAEPKQSRSTRYCSDLAHAFSSPIFHVNALDMQAVDEAFSLALGLRTQFGCDVVIDLIGYRKWGHNESDEPRYTQPLMYKKIGAVTGCADQFHAYCEQLGYDFAKEEFLDHLSEELEGSFEKAKQRIESLCLGLEHEKEHKVTASHLSCEKVVAFQKALRSISTKCKKADLTSIAEKVWSEKALPTGFSPHRKIAQLMQNRLSKVQEGKDLDWGCCETLAYGSILSDGKAVRLSGQDSERGTFSHRHLQIVDQKTQKKHSLLSSLGGEVEIFSSPLSEFAVMGFEYGITQIRKEGLTIWEAQFGDFCNGAQVVIDQFLSSAQSKWNTPSRLVLFLPHGYEGQGPEHSSARIERFLALSSKENWTVCQLSRPSGLFHLLRRQVHSPIARPLVLFTPKGLLRHPQCVSSLEELSSGVFEEVLFPQVKIAPRTLVLCSGRIFYDIEQQCDLPDDIALATIEQLYPLPVDLIETFLQKHPSIKEVIWIQEEPENMGPMTWIKARLWPHLSGKYRLRDLGRERSSSTATGYLQAHEHELKTLIGKLQEILYSGS